MEAKGLIPIIILFSDGEPTDDFENGLQTLTNSGWGKKTLRTAVQIGNITNPDFLSKFISDQEFGLLQVNNLDLICDFLEWTKPLRINENSVHNRFTNKIVLPPPPPANDDSEKTDIW